MSTPLSYHVNGGYPIHGELTCMGAKNLATKAMIASMLTDEEVVLTNMPSIGDVQITASLLKSLGSKIVISRDSYLESASLDDMQDLDNSSKMTMTIQNRDLISCEAKMPDSRTNRIPILLLAPLLHRLKKGVVPIVGGDQIGARNVDFHIDAIRAFGANIIFEEDRYIVNTDRKRLQAAHITLPYPSVGATEAIIFLAVLSEGTSIIRNVALEPEIIALITMLNSMNAQIFICNNRELIIHGVEKLCGAKMEIIGDRLEAASWATLACASNGRILVHGVDPMLLNNFLPHYTAVGGGYRFASKNAIEFYRAHSLKSTIIETDCYPGFSTDLQQPFSVLLTQASGISVMHETVYESRFGYINALNSLGANIQVVPYCLGAPCRYHGCNYMHSALINGPTPLSSDGASIYIPDIRAGLAYFVAAILANGRTELVNAGQLERGYGNLIHKLRNTNVQLRRDIS